MTIQERVLEIDVSSNTVLLDNISVELPKLSIGLLLELALVAPAPLSNADIQDRVWKGVHVSADAVKQRVRLLRTALDENGIGRGWIKTAPGKGYFLDGPVQILQTQKPTESSGLWRNLTEKLARFRFAGMPERALLTGALLILVLLSTFVYFANTEIANQENDGELRVAVLPFTEINKDNTVSPIGTGLREELTGLLSHHDEIVSVAASPSLALSDMRTKEIGSKFDVAAIIAGNVRSDGLQRRFSVRLIDTDTEALNWSGEYSLPASAGLRDWSRIALHISKMVTLELEREIAPASRPGGTKNIEAYRIYLTGVDLLKKPLGADTYEAAAQIFDEALRLDPDFTLARARLSECLARLSLIDATNMHYADRALQQSQIALDDGGDLAEANYAHGLALLALGREGLAGAFLNNARRQRPYLAMELDRLKAGSNGR